MQGQTTLTQGASKVTSPPRRYVWLGALWLSLLTLLWGITPWVLCQVRVVAVLAVFSSLLALLGWLLPWQPLVMWSGIVGLGNFTLALLVTAAPPNAFLGLSVGCILFALLDGSQHFAYVRHCHIGPGVIAVLLRAVTRLCGISLLAGLSMAFFLSSLPVFLEDSSTAIWLTLGGAVMFVGFLALFLFQSSR